jgi:hypothetical protein
VRGGPVRGTGHMITVIAGSLSPCYSHGEPRDPAGARRAQTVTERGKIPPVAFCPARLLPDMYARLEHQG